MLKIKNSSINSSINSSNNSSNNSSINNMIITNEYYTNDNQETINNNIKKIKKKYNIILNQINSFNLNKIK